MIKNGQHQQQLDVKLSTSTSQGWTRDVKARDRDETETLESRNPDETETLALPAETRR